MAEVGALFDEVVLLPSLLLLTAFAAALYARRYHARTS
jgi:hypothetical protein